MNHQRGRRQWMREVGQVKWGGRERKQTTVGHSPTARSGAINWRHIKGNVLITRLMLFGTTASSKLALEETCR